MVKSKGWSTFDEVYLLPKPVFQRLFDMLAKPEQEVLRKTIYESHDPERFVPSTETVLAGPPAERVNDPPEHHEAQRMGSVDNEQLPGQFGSPRFDQSHVVAGAVPMAVEEAPGSTAAAAAAAANQPAPTPTASRAQQDPGSVPEAIQERRIVQRPVGRPADYKDPAVKRKRHDSSDDDDPGHWDVVEHAGAFPCTICGGTFTRKSSLKRHMENLHGQAVDPSAGRKAKVLWRSGVPEKRVERERKFQRWVEPVPGVEPKVLWKSPSATTEPSTSRSLAPSVPHSSTNPPPRPAPSPSRVKKKNLPSTTVKAKKALLEKKKPAKVAVASAVKKQPLKLLFFGDKGKKKPAKKAPLKTKKGVAVVVDQPGPSTSTGRASRSKAKSTPGSRLKVSVPRDSDIEDIVDLADKTKAGKAQQRRRFAKWKT